MEKEELVLNEKDGSKESKNGHVDIVSYKKKDWSTHNEAANNRDSDGKDEMVTIVHKNASGDITSTGENARYHR